MPEPIEVESTRVCLDDLTCSLLKNRGEQTGLMRCLLTLGYLVLISPQACQEPKRLQARTDCHRAPWMMHKKQRQAACSTCSCC